MLLLETDWLDKYKANILSSIKKLRFILKGKTIEIDVINVRDQMIKTSEIFTITMREECFYEHKSYIYRGKNWKYLICQADDGHCKHYYCTKCGGNSP